MPVPNFSPGEVLTASAMDSIGLWEIATVTFSASSSVVVDNVFSADYNDYRVIVNATGSATGFSGFQFRNGSGNITGLFYRGQAVRAFGTSVDGINDFNQSSYPAFMLTYGTGTNRTITTSDICTPFSSSTATVATYQNFCDNAPSSVSYTSNGGFLYAQNAQATGFRLVPSSGTITGSLTVYGYNKG
jgi:hypothetical protein